MIYNDNVGQRHFQDFAGVDQRYALVSFQVIMKGTQGRRQNPVPKVLGRECAPRGCFQLALQTFLIALLLPELGTWNIQHCVTDTVSVDTVSVWILILLVQNDSLLLYLEPISISTLCLAVSIYLEWLTYGFEILSHISMQNPVVQPES